MNYLEIINLSYATFFFILGTILGSFYNVVAYRLPHGGSIISPPSHCPNCDHKLTPIELIPILSFIIQGGKCKSCKRPISFFYPVFELLTGILFTISFYIFGLSWNLLIALIVVSMLLIVIISDSKYMVISDEVLLVSSILLVITFFLKDNYDFLSLLYHILDGLIAFTIMYLIKMIGDRLFKKESMGGGDIKLMFVLGLALGPITALCVIFLSSFIALPGASLQIFINKKDILPFGPYISIAALCLLLFQINDLVIINWLTTLYR